MKHNITRRDFLKVTGGGLAVASLGLGVPFINTAHAAKALSVVDWGPPWIDSTKQIAKAWGKASDQLDFTFRRCSLGSSQD